MGRRFSASATPSEDSGASSPPEEVRQPETKAAPLRLPRRRKRRPSSKPTPSEAEPPSTSPAARRGERGKPRRPQKGKPGKPKGETDVICDELVEAATTWVLQGGTKRSTKDRIRDWVALKYPSRSEPGKDTLQTVISRAREQANALAAQGRKGVRQFLQGFAMGVVVDEEHTIKDRLRGAEVLDQIVGAGAKWSGADNMEPEEYADKVREAIAGMDEMHVEVEDEASSKT